MRGDRPVRTAGKVVVAVALLAAAAIMAPLARADEPPRLPAQKLLTITDPQISEASGIAASRLDPGVVFVLQDSRRGPYLYAIGRDGSLLATFTLPGAVNVDWEALAPGVDENGDPILWIADIGDNDARRSTIRLFRINEPEQLVDSDIGWGKITLTYPDGPHDAEALLVNEASGRMYVVTKQAFDAGTYAVPEDAQRGGTYELTRVGDAPAVVTDGAISPDGRRIVLRTYRDAVIVEGPGGVELARGRLPASPQGESLGFTADGNALLVGSEGVNQPVWSVRMPEVDAGSSPAATDATGATSTQATARPWSGLPYAIGLAAVIVVGLVLGLLTRVRRDDRDDASQVN